MTEIQIEWQSDEPKDYRTNGRGWTAKVERRGSSGWAWTVEIDSPKTTAQGVENSSAEAKQKVVESVARLLHAYRCVSLKHILETPGALPKDAFLQNTPPPLPF